MGNRIFGKPIVEQPKPKISLQEQILILEKRKDHLEKLVDVYDKKAKISSTKEDAIRNLNLKINYGNEIKTLYGMIYKLEKLDRAQQQVEFQKNIITAAKQTTELIKQNMINPDDVSDALFESDEAIKEIEHISEELGRTEPIDQELQAELDKLFTNTEEQKVPEVSNVETIIELPTPPTNKVKENEMEKELKMLMEA